MRDRDEKGRTLVGDKHGRAKLTKEDVRAIRDSDETGRDLSERYGMSRAQISRIKNHKNWKHVMENLTSCPS
jgi:hypothetical protein